MSAALVFVGKFYESDDHENSSVVTAKVAIDINNDAPAGFHDFFERIKYIEDEYNYEYFYEESDLTWEGVFYDWVNDLVFDHPDYFTIRWFKGVEVEPNLNNLSSVPITSRER